MRKNYSIYDSATGRIIAQITCDDTEIAANAAANNADAYIEGTFSWDDYYIDNGVLTAFPEKPSDIHVWDWVNGGWSDPRTLDGFKQEKLGALAVIAEDKLSVWTGPTAPVGGIQIDDVSTGRMTSWAAKALVCLMTNSSFDLPYWIMLDNSHHSFADANEFIAFASLVGDHKTAVILNNSRLKLLILDAADQAALDAIDLNDGWP